MPIISLLVPLSICLPVSLQYFSTNSPAKLFTFFLCQFLYNVSLPILLLILLSLVCVCLSFFLSFLFFFSFFFIILFSFSFFFFQNKEQVQSCMHTTPCWGGVFFFSPVKTPQCDFFSCPLFRHFATFFLFSDFFFFDFFLWFLSQFFSFLSLSLSLSLSFFFFFFIFLKTQKTEQQLYFTNFSCVDFSWNFSSNFCYLGFFFSFFLSFFLFFLSFFSKKNTIHKEQTQNSIFCIFLFPLPH